MKIIIGGETGWEYFERLAYDGAIGIFYKDTFSGVIAYIIFGIIIALAIIGLCSVIKWLFKRKKNK